MSGRVRFLVKYQIGRSWWNWAWYSTQAKALQAAKSLQSRTHRTLVIDWETQQVIDGPAEEWTPLPQSPWEEGSR